MNTGDVMSSDVCSMECIKIQLQKSVVNRAGNQSSFCKLRSRSSADKGKSSSA